MVSIKSTISYERKAEVRNSWVLDKFQGFQNLVLPVLSTEHEIIFRNHNHWDVICHLGISLIYLFLSVSCFIAFNLLCMTEKLQFYADIFLNLVQSLRVVLPLITGSYLLRDLLEISHRLCIVLSRLNGEMIFLSFSLSRVACFFS